MPRGGRNVPSLKERFALKGKMLVKMHRGAVVVQRWPKPYGPPRSQAQADTITAFKKIQRALKFLPPSQTITAMEVTAKTGMYPRDLLMQGMLGTNILLAYEAQGRHAMIGDGLDKFVASGGEGSYLFDNIPAGYSELMLVLNGRQVNNVSAGGPKIQFNNDTGNNYDEEWANFLGTTTLYTQSYFAMADLPGSTQPANYSNSARMWIPGYSSPNFYKSGFSLFNSITATSGSGMFQNYRSFWWRNLQPISQILLTFPALASPGTTAVLYGLF